MIHSTPRPSRSPSYSRHMDSAAVSSNSQRHNQRTGMTRRVMGLLTWLTRRGFAKRLSGRLNRQLSRRLSGQLTSLFRFIRRPLLRQAWPQGLEVSLVWYQLCVMSVCPRISRGLKRCLITRTTYSLGHGLKAMRWPWSYWKSVTLQWPSTSP